MSRIHPTAIVEDGARLGQDVEIGPYCTVGSEVELGDGVRLQSHVVVEGRTRIGEGTRVWPFAFLGGPPQDLKYKGEKTEVEIGRHCLLREYVTVHGGTSAGRGRTVVGDHCFLMLGSHVAHDCVLGDHVILVNNVVISGHCEVGDRVVVGALSAVQQRTKVGAHAFVGMVTGVDSNVVPYAMASARGSRAEISGLNVIGLRRRGFDQAAIMTLRSAYRAYFEGSGSREERIAALRAQHPDDEMIAELADFIEACGDAPMVRRR